MQTVINQKSKKLLKKLKIDCHVKEDHSWINILRKGEQAPRHCHILKNEKSISWVLFLSDSDTNLNLESPHMFYEEETLKYNTYLRVLTRKGTIIFFPSWVFHFTDVHKEFDQRISIAGKFVLDIK